MATKKKAPKAETLAQMRERMKARTNTAPRVDRAEETRTPSVAGAIERIDRLEQDVGELKLQVKEVGAVVDGKTDEIAEQHWKLSHVIADVMRLQNQYTELINTLYEQVVSEEPDGEQEEGGEEEAEGEPAIDRGEGGIDRVENRQLGFDSREPDSEGVSGPSGDQPEDSPREAEAQ